MATTREELVPGLRATSYVYEPTHHLLATDAHMAAGPNIGWDGSNLTITFLSLNRAELSLRLLKSIEEHAAGFAGEVLIVDNGSSKTELDKLRAYSATAVHKMRVVELDRNYGVAGGRNRTVPEVGTDWVLWLDNDIYFRGNPLEAIQRDLGVLGSHFLNLPLLDRDGQTIFAKGGHLYPGIDAGEIRIGAGSAYPQTPMRTDRFEPFLSTFLFGGACVLNKATFESLGGYDENMFVGFEDIDLSIRIFQAGLKIGNAGVYSLVHDHPPPGSDDDRDYEKRRFARETLTRSAEYLEAKLGFRVWNASTEEWLKDNERRLGITSQPTPEEQGQRDPSAAVELVDGRAKIALLVDTDSWAFWNIAQQLCRRLGARFDFRVIPTEVIGNAIQTFLLGRDCDIVHVFWREYLPQLGLPHCRTYVEWLGANYTEFLRDVVKRPVLSTAIYDHLWLDEDALRQRLPVYRDFVDAYYVGSRRLRDVYRSIPEYPAPLMVLEDGVDPELFYPLDLQRFQSVGCREVVLGWTGNSNWASELGDFKGVHTILRPAVEQLRADGMAVRLELADRAESALIPHNQMRNYYAKIDLYVCTSEIEGTPNPVLESMACGVPVISTDVGVVPDVFGSQQSEFILEQRSVQCLKQAIRRLVSRPSLFRKLSAENLESIRSWYWENKVTGFAQYFTKCLELRSQVGPST